MEPLFYLALTWVSVFVAAVLADLTRLTAVLYFLAIGSLLANLGVLPVETHPFIRGFADLGIIAIMFALGFEETTSNFVRSIKRSWGIALFGALGPFCMAYGVAEYFWNDTRTSLMCGLAMASTTVALSMVSLQSEGLQRSRAATGIMTAAVVDNIASLILVAIIIPLATGQTALSPAGIGLTILKAFSFFFVIAALAHWIFPHNRTSWMASIPYFGKRGIKNFLGFGEGQHTTLSVLILAVGCALAAHAFGLHMAVGAYLAGLILKEEYFDLSRKPEINAYKETKKRIDNIAFSWIGPVFFVTLGTQIIFDWEIFRSVIPETATMLIGLIIAQITCAGLAARYLGGFKWAEGILIGCGMLGRAELAFVVMDIAYVQYKIINAEVFFTLMGVAFWLNIAVPVSIKLWKLYFKDHKLAVQ